MKVKARKRQSRQKLKHQCREEIDKEMEAKWREKSSHEQYKRETGISEVDKEKTYRWLRKVN